MTQFEIATVHLEGGGRIGICPLPGRWAPLEHDLVRIAAWEPRFVLSMTEQAEMDAAGVGQLGDLLQTRRIGWFHLPVRDYGGPSAEQADLWPEVSGQLHACLDSAGSVLVHCRGGMGRSGMIALRLMAERGEDPRKALARLRKARPGAVETDDQYAWASAGAEAHRGQTQDSTL